MPLPLYRVFAFLILLSACKRPPAPPPPDYCAQDLSGVWVNSSDKHFAYRLRDHGGFVRGEFMERADDGGLTKPDDPMLIELHRADGGISGVMKTHGPSLTGRDCPVEYGFDVTVCQQSAMQAQVEVTANINDDCKRASLPDGGEIPPELREFRLERAAGDGGP
jgi:hypothetical protein